ncbi:avidin-like [Crotalus adamanteus]|uniref:Avidin-like n=1 Tax=Crotalus adamanteus TaxID=8729 RepID=A0AAW1BP78_CROAD
MLLTPCLGRWREVVQAELFLLWRNPPATSLCSGGRQEQLVGAGGLRRGCRFLGVDCTWYRHTEHQKPWDPNGWTLRVSSSSSLIGTWKNDLNSTMEINSVGNMGVFSGLYKTAVSASDNPIRPSPLQGIQHQEPQPTFGFTINWNFWLCQKARMVFLCVGGGGESHL